jgi:hypothetical protein
MTAQNELAHLANAARLQISLERIVVSSCRIVPIIKTLCSVNFPSFNPNLAAFKAAWLGWRKLQRLRVPMKSSGLSI